MALRPIAALPQPQPQQQPQQQPQFLQQLLTLDVPADVMLALHGMREQLTDHPTFRGMGFVPSLEQVASLCLFTALRGEALSGIAAAAASPPQEPPQRQEQRQEPRQEPRQEQRQEQPTWPSRFSPTNQLDRAHASQTTIVLRYLQRGWKRFLYRDARKNPLAGPSGQLGLTHQAFWHPDPNADFTPSWPVYSRQTAKSDSAWSGVVHILEGVDPMAPMMPLGVLAETEGGASADLTTLV